eukprot:3709483-Pleurochrysis_carterae.AAC.1
MAACHARALRRTGWSAALRHGRRRHVRAGARGRVGHVLGRTDCRLENSSAFLQKFVCTS